MCQLFETIKIINGKPNNLHLHEKRMNVSRQRLFDNNDILSLSDSIQVPEDFQSGIIKCRVIYNSSIKTIEYSSYIPADVKTLKKVDGGNLLYNLKYVDRSRLISLIDKSIADDILIVKNGYVTDASYANIVFTDGKVWVTPDTPLLYGTMREILILKGVIESIKIRVEDLSLYTHFRLINAMLGFEAPVIPLSGII